MENGTIDPDEGFHWQDGWFFERLAFDDPVAPCGVRIRKREQGTGRLEAEAIIGADAWASIVASVCASGEESHMYHIARALHG